MNSTVGHEAVKRLTAANKNYILRRVGKDSNREIARHLDVNESTIRRFLAAQPKPEAPQPKITFHDKKVGGINWRESTETILKMQELRDKSGWGQSFAKITVGDGSCPIAILFLSDTHIGAFGANYRHLLELTDIILNTPNLYVALVGDIVEMAIKLRSVAEVCAQVLDPHLQTSFVESWIEEIKHKIIFSTWGNHETDRNEAAAGACPIKNILARVAPYFSGIGHADVTVGKETYLLCASHKFQGVTALDVTAGGKKYLRMEAPDREIAVQGDAHRAGVSLYNEGGKRKLAMCSGTLNINSGFAKRYFSLKTSEAFPVLALWPDEHRFVPFFTIDDYLSTAALAEAA